MSKDRSQFEWTSEEFHEAWQLFGQEMQAWWDNLASKVPGGQISGQAARELFPLQTEETSLKAALKELQQRLEGRVEIVGHPGYLAYVAGAANPIAPLAQALAMMINPYTGTYATAPACVELEEEALLWIKELVGWPKEAFAWITSGSSLAIFSAVIAARETVRAPVGKRRVYVSDQAHHCVGKACFSAGFEQDELSILPSRQGRMVPELLIEAIQRDKKFGLTPVLVVATAGTTNAGLVDPLDAIATICEDEQVWYHIDGAYGGFFHMLPEIECLKGLARADSLSLDPHKALCMPYGTGILLWKKGDALRWPRGLNASYMPPLTLDELRYEYSDISPELSRDFRGLRLWLSLKVFGREAYREHLVERYHLAQELAQRCAQDARLELFSAPDLSLFAWAIRGDLKGEKTAALLKEIHATGRFFMTSCRFEGRLAIRTCILGFRFHQRHLEELWQILQTSLGRVMG